MPASPVRIFSKILFSIVTLALYQFLENINGIIRLENFAYDILIFDSLTPVMSKPKPSFDLSTLLIVTKLSEEP